MSAIANFLTSESFDYIHTLLFVLLLLTPLFVSQKKGSFIYYWCLCILVSWGINDGNCIIMNLDKKDEYDLQNGLMVDMVNKMGIKTPPTTEFIIRLVFSLSAVCILYYYSSRTNFQKLLAWCIGWTLITVEGMRYIHIKNHGRKVLSFKNRMREFKKKWLA